MTPSELLHQAKKYRLVALILSPTVQGPQDREYYLSRALELEQQAQAATVATSTEPPKCIESTQILPPPAPTIILKNQTRVHSNLAVAVLGDKRQGIHRAFTIWLTLHRQNSAWFDYNDVLNFYADETGNHPRNVRRWLDAGNGIFWIYGQSQGKRTLSIIGKDRVFAGYKLDDPGRVLLVDTDQLLGKLQQARAALYATWIGGKNNKWASRATIENLTNVTERTQLNYDHQNQQKKQKTFAVDWQIESGKPRQLPNRYHAVYHPAHNGQSGKKRYGLYTLENNGATKTNVNEGTKRILFDNPNGAVQTARKRAKQGQDGQCFAIIGDTKRGNLLVKTIDYGVFV